MKIVFSIIFFGVAAYMIFIQRKKTKNKTLEIKSMATKNVEDLKTLFNQMDDTGLSGYREYVEIKGTLDDQDTIDTPFSRQRVAYCEAKLIQKTEETEQYRDSQGNLRTRRNTHTNEVFSNKSSEYLNVKDNGSGENIVVELSNGCNLDLPKTYDSFMDGARIGSQNFAIGYSFSNFVPNLLGYQMEEKTIKHGQSIYAIGEAYKIGNEIHIGKPTDKKKPFIVTTKSEEELVNASDKQAKTQLITGVICAVVGVILLFV